MLSGQPSAERREMRLTTVEPNGRQQKLALGRATPSALKTNEPGRERSWRERPGRRPRVC